MKYNTRILKTKEKMRDFSLEFTIGLRPISLRNSPLIFLYKYSNSLYKSVLKFMRALAFI